MKTISLVVSAMIGLLGVVHGQQAPTNKPPRVLCVWDANPETDIAGYKIYQGTNSRVYDLVFDIPCVVSNGITVRHNTNWIGSNLVRGVTHYFAATAYNTLSLESDFSEEVSLDIAPIPLPPVNLKVSSIMANLDLTSILLKAEDPAGPWMVAMSWTNRFAPSSEPEFYRIGLNISRAP